jgi:outer membrane protein assembly factor BamA
LPVTQAAPTRIVAQDGFARIESWDWAGQGANLGVRGQVRLRDLQAGILANGELALRLLTPFVRAAGLTTTGRLTPRLSITGRLDAPRVDGDVTIDGGELRLNDPRVVIANLTARAVLSRTNAQLTALAGSINGGEFTGGGEVRVEAGERVSGTLSASIREMALEFPAGLRTGLNADLTVDLEQGLAEGAAPSGRVGGTVTVLRGSYREPLAVVGGLLAALRAPVAMAEASSPLLEALALDIRVITDSDLEVNNNTARLQIGGDLRVTGTAAAPGVSGRADLQPGGRVFLGRNSYEIVSGRIDFTDPFTIRPELAIDLTTRAGGEDIDVSLSGGADNPSVELSSSNPDLTQADLTALLVTGRRFDQLASADAALIGDAVVGNLAGDVLGFAGRAVGLDTLRLGGVDSNDTRRDPTAVATETDPTSRLTFGRSFGADVDVTLSQSLRRGDAQTWIVDYSPFRGLLLRLVSNDSDLRAYEFRHDIAIGGPPRVQSANASRPADIRIVAVRVEGTLAVPEARIRDLLQHDAGERFDFGAWQDDRDRLERFYRDENRLAARIASSRVPENGGVALVYVIQAGPETRIATTGATLPGAVLDRVRDAWAASILNDFFVAEVTDIVTSALVDDGYLRPRVQPQIADAGDIRTLTIATEPGTQTRDLRVVVSAPDDAVARDLEAWAADGGRARLAMREPAAFEAAATGLLHERGFVAPTVAVGAVRFDGDAATVPVTVATGLALGIRAVRFEGATLALDLLQESADLEAGAPLNPADVGLARDRVLAVYRREGFPDARVDAGQSRIAGTAMVDVVFTIAEGARQTIADVRVEGNRRTDVDVITRALGVTTGQPLRSEEIVQGRRRLFDTGLFRRVDVTTEVGEGSGRPMLVRVAVEEWPALRIRYGLGATEELSDDDLGSRNLVGGFYADATRRTLLGRAIATGVAARYQPRDRMARLFLNSPTLLSLPVESSLALERTREEFTSASLVTDITAISWGQRSRLAERLELSYSYRFERNRTYDTDPAPGSVVVFDETVKVARFTGSAVWDGRNSPSDATRGLFLAGTVEWGPQSVGSDFRFVKQLAQAYQFTPWRGVVFASAARLGVVVPLGGQEVILSERFFAGGARTVRGVAEEGLGERDFFGPLGGQAMLLLNQEIRFPIYRWVRGVGFVDAGNVFAQPRDLSFGQLTASVGAGLRLTTPFAVLRADYGHVPTLGQGRWTFGIGHAF